VTSITDFGIFLEIEEGIDALIQVSEIRKENSTPPRAFTEYRQELEAVVLNVDTASARSPCSIKQLEDSKVKANVESYLGSQKQRHFQPGRAFFRGRWKKPTRNRKSNNKPFSKP
jgi:small subunit ribosomal protein S1